MRGPIPAMTADSGNSLAGILLAAGGSSRLGQPKQLLKYRGEALVRRAAQCLCSYTYPTFIVTGAYRKETLSALAGTAVREVHHPAWSRGMGSSIRAGVKALDEDCEAVLILLCDQYRIEDTDLSRLCAAWAASPATITCASWSGRLGPPAIFPRSEFSALLSLEGDEGARKLITAGHANAVPMPHAAHDVDTPQSMETMTQS